MTISNRLAQSDAQLERVIPPQGKSPEQKAARQQFWIDRGNAHLAEMGMRQLHWVCRNDFYVIEERRFSSEPA
jgi:hypothetical protein